MSKKAQSVVEADSAGPKTSDPLCSALATVTEMLRSARVEVTSDDAVIAGIPTSLLSAIRRVNDELKHIDEARNLAGFAHALACICGGNVPRATVNITFDGQVDDNGHGYTSRTALIETADTRDGEDPTMAPFVIDEMESLLECEFHLGFLEATDTQFSVTSELAAKLFSDGDYKAFLRSTAPSLNIA